VKQASRSREQLPPNEKWKAVWYAHSAVWSLVSRLKRRQIVYPYQIHPQVGWMYARIQTSFPFHIQFGLNGREWRARQMDHDGLKYRQQGNCFVWIEDYGQLRN
jgi:hypothetical protein